MPFTPLPVSRVCRIVSTSPIKSYTHFALGYWVSVELPLNVVTLLDLSSLPLTSCTALSALPKLVCTALAKSVLGIPPLGLSYFALQAVLFAAVTNLFVVEVSSTKSELNLLLDVISLCKPATKSATLNSIVEPLCSVRTTFLFVLS